MENLTLKQFSEAVSSKDPTPGGGGVSAAVGALAASLGEMVTNLTFGKKKYLEYTFELTDIRKELEILRINLLGCINKDAQAFEPLAKVYALPKDSEGYEEKMEECLRKAAEPPFLILKYAARIIELDERLGQIGSKLAVSDAATSVMLAHGVLYAAYVNVLVNTHLMKDRDQADYLNEESVKILDEYSVMALNIYDDICKRLTE
ncbi:MAG: cyclodeaminase/cyclohydrolase family protein, partial [Erysipelotrichaceae bacterium]|nr:cyclodeaminase/cyclohydrolase family protein [Erysipelotrichaceae bacterium]MBQ1740471.1 cyclodeaminase/cyclohydrolase family protein [Erysipelotrichaceae bacterium]MBQ1775462.1 cyclodeaminase/cyclohydrolase family protein [Erysipelotrichaceae bacterium]MBQ2138585.1 cyclodeaminase/cyclohydrolase family protein [Erysipelotrichaceae bacterium]MBQ2505079.1 cyclodeaminase/cyclohydrolase family protein [Erysipelotrichaceae bacterium]